MPGVHRSVASLRFRGDDLDPAQISQWLGAQPSRFHRKGDTQRLSTSGTLITRPTGFWLLRASDRGPEDLDGQVKEILDQLTNDLDVWARLGRYSPDLFVGLFLEESNEGLELSCESMRALSERGIRLGLDIYGPMVEDAIEPPPPTSTDPPS